MNTSINLKNNKDFSDGEVGEPKKKRRNFFISPERRMSWIRRW